MINRLVLGTVELGLPYGLNNQTGQPSKEESFAILDTAFATGLNIFDTAWGYGSAEDILGDWIKSRHLKNKVRIISKLKPHVLNDYPDGAKAKDIINQEIHKSLTRLNLDHLDGYLLHTPHYIYNQHIIDGLMSAQTAGLIKNFGVSIYDEAEALYAANLPVNYIQIPYNIFDQRLDRADFFNLVKKNNITVFARSPFLQGLLLMKPPEIPERVSPAKPLLKELNFYLEKNNISPLSAALAFALQHPHLPHIVFGVNSVKEIKECLQIASNPPLIPSEFFSFVKNNFSQVDKAVVTPSLWKIPKKKP